MAELLTEVAIDKNNIFVHTPAMDDVEIKKLIGANLRRIRIERDMKGIEAADIAGISPGQYSRYENGRGISYSTLAHMCNVFEVDPIEFFRPISGIGRVNESHAEYGKLVDPRTTEEFIIPDDSMVPRYYPGETIYVTRRSTEFKEGDFVLVHMRDTGTRIVRQIHTLHQGTLLSLSALNSSYPPIFYEKKKTIVHQIIASRPIQADKTIKKRPRKLL